MKSEHVSQAVKNRNILEITTLGRFQVRRGDETLSRESTRSYRLWELFKYLITYRDKETYSEVIMENLWPEQDYADPRHTLRTLVYRLRQLLDNKEDDHTVSCIKFSHGAYSLNTNIDYWLDAEVFDKLCREASRAEPESAIAAFQQALSLYQGDYLPELAYSEWVIPIRNYYHRLYIQAVLDVTDLMKERKMYGEIIKVCERAFLIEFFEEEIHLRFLEALIESGKLHQALAHYEYVTAVFYRELGVKPSSSMRALYRLMQQDDTIPSFDLEAIQETLLDRKGLDGAFFCDPEVFRFLYKLEMRRVERTGQSIFLVMLTLTGKNMSSPYPHILRESLNGLQHQLVSGLRRGDVITRWNDSQLLVILPGLNYEQAERVMERLTSGFIRLAKAQDIVLHQDIKPVSSATLQVG